MDEWIRSHVIEAPQRTRDFCGDLMKGARVLNVGCGEMLMDLGLIGQGAASIMGLDVHDKPGDWLETLANKVRRERIDFPRDYARRLAYTRYDGRVFPFENASFDVVFSWSAFEHIADIDAVLREMHRVLRPDGAAFVQVFPWHGSRYGSHLDGWIKQPFFHHVEDHQWVHDRLQEAALERPEGERPFITNYMFSEYVSLNRKSCNDFYEAARDAGFVIAKARVGAYDEDLTHAPRGVAFHDLMIGETMMLMRKGGPA